MGSVQVTVAFTYDINGRVLTETISPGTANQARRSYSYQFSSGTVAANVVTTDALGGRYITRYDGMNRVLSVAQLVGTAEQRLRADVYNPLGQLVTRNEFDRIDGQERTLTTQYAYDGWGHQDLTTHPDRSQVIDRYNPITRTREQGTVGSRILRSVENQFDKPVTVDQVATNGQTIRLYSRTFDGLGRCISETNVDNMRSVFAYDNVDRITSDTQTPLAGGQARVLAYAYPVHMVEAYASSLTVNNIVLGRRTYDGVGRLLMLTRGNNAGTTSWTYPNRTLRASQIRLPSGLVQQLQYNTQLDRITQINAGNQVDGFGLHAVSGSVTSTSNAESQHSLQRDTFDRVISESQSINGQNFSNTYSYSTLGRLTRQTTALGDTEARTYDTSGRFASAQITGGTAGTSDIGVSYDGVSRISATSVVTSNGNFSSTVAYDVFGRDARREMRQGGSVVQVIEVGYHPNNKIASRRITGTGGTVISNESFSYDGFGRIVQYDNAGPQYAVDQSGRSIRSQRFVYDALNNITQAVTGLVSGADDVATRLHQHADPTQLSRITGTNPQRVIELAYDPSGQLSREGGREFQFNNMEQLIQVRNGAQVQSSYGYDAAGLQIRLSDAAGGNVGQHYSADRLTGVSQGTARARYVRHEETVLARSISGMGSEVNGSDGAASVRVVASGSGMQHVQYAPYGMSGIDAGGAGTLLQRSRPAFNGERYDPLGQLYHLGNGRRAYSPELMIFLSADPLSPFGEGGINSYGYCAGDPVNFIDPSGLSEMPAWARWLLIGLGVLVGGVMIAGVGSAMLTAVRTAIRLSTVLNARASSLSGLGRGAARAGNLSSNAGGVFSNIATAGRDIGRGVSNMGQPASNLGASLSNVGVVGARSSSVASNAVAGARSWGVTASRATAPARSHVGFVGRGISNVAGSLSNVRGNMVGIAAMSSQATRTAGVAIRADFARNARPRVDLDLFSDEMLFEPMAGEVLGMIAGVQDVDSDFGELADQIRASEALA